MKVSHRLPSQENEGEYGEGGQEHEEGGRVEEQQVDEDFAELEQIICSYLVSGITTDMSLLILKTLFQAFLRFFGTKQVFVFQFQI